MDLRLIAYLERVDAVLASEPTEADLPFAVRGLAQELFAEGLELEAGFRASPATGHARNLVWRDARNRFVVVAMVWPPGIEGPPHDHGTWGVVCVLEGCVRIVDYGAPTFSGGRAQLTPRRTVVATAGQCAHVAPPPDDWHAVGNASDRELALTLHTYGRTIDRCRVFDTATGQLETIEPKYTNLGCTTIPSDPTVDG